jgi:hypothetical protein
LAFAAWFIIVLTLGADRFFASGPGALGLSRVQLAIISPLIVFWLAYHWVPPFSDFVRTADLVSLTSLQVARVLALSHVVSWGYGLMAGVFALTVASGNFVVFLTAMYAIPAVARNTGNWRTRVLAMSLVGLAEFAMTIALAVLGLFSTPTSFDPPINPAGYVSFATPPLSIFPTYLIPAMTIIHFITLLALSHQSQQGWSKSSNE